MSTRRFGIFGGSFDPVHNAHLALARVALDELRLDQMIWVPAGQPWQKERQITPAVHREAMVRLAIEDEPRFMLCRAEIERSGPSYTIDTVRELRATQDRGSQAKWFLVIGQDQYAKFHTWHGWRELLKLATLAIANRPDAVLEADAEVMRVAHEAVALPMMDISSTDIRERIAHGQGIADLVPATVARYIAGHRLYQDQTPLQELNGHS